MLRPNGQAFRFYTGHDEEPCPHNRYLTYEPVRCRDLHYEVNRLATFANWNYPNAQKERLALLGFYFYGPSDITKCFKCGIEIGLWEEGDDVALEHIRWSPECALINGEPTDNIPIDRSVFESALPPRPIQHQANTTPERPVSFFGNITTLPSASNSAGEEASFDEHRYNHQNQNHQNNQNRGVNMTFGIVFVGGGFGATPSAPSVDAHPSFSLESDRFSSFSDWPKSISQRPEELSAAGFYYSGRGDCVTCFSCGGGLKDWMDGQVPWEQHGMWYGKCEYVKLVKGHEFIEKMAKKRDEFLNNDPKGDVECSAETKQDFAESSDSDEDETVVGEDRMCKICLFEASDTIFLPCGHVVACGKCAYSLTKCPVCRNNSTKSRVYFS